MDFKYIYLKFLIILISTTLSSCSYDLKESINLNSKIKNIEIVSIIDNSLFPGNKIKPKFLYKLRSNLLKNNHLRIVKNNADILIKGEFLRYNLIPNYINFDGKWEKSIIIKFHLYYINLKKPEKDFEKEFKLSGNFIENQIFFSKIIQKKIISSMINELADNIYKEIIINS